MLLRRPSPADRCLYGIACGRWQTPSSLAPPAGWLRLPVRFAERKAPPYGAEQCLDAIAGLPARVACSCARGLRPHLSQGLANAIRCSHATDRKHVLAAHEPHNFGHPMLWGLHR